MANKQVKSLAYKNRRNFNNNSNHNHNHDDVHDNDLLTKNVKELIVAAAASVLLNGGRINNSNLNRNSNQNHCNCNMNLTESLFRCGQLHEVIQLN